MFRQHFNREVLDGDYIECIVKRGINRFRVRAWVERDNDTGPYEDNFDWRTLRRSHYKTDATFYKQVAQNALAEQAFKDDEWFYCGVILTVSLVDEELDSGPYHMVGGHGDELVLVSRYEVALWGIEANYPVFDKRRRSNTRLRDLANEQLGQALETAEKALVAYVTDKVTMAYGRAA